jgi:hypothetical protein
MVLVGEKSETEDASRRIEYEEGAGRKLWESFCQDPKRFFSIFLSEAKRKGENLH